MAYPLRLTCDATRFLLGDQPIQILSGELHYFRVPRAYWRDRLLKARALGLNTVCTYMPWNLHEPLPGQFDFNGDDGRLDIAAFVREAQRAGLWVILRPGPYICAEWDFGGLPGWLLAETDARVRCADANYLVAVERYLRRVGEEVGGLTCARGGPIIMTQVENEYGSYSNDKVYLARLRRILQDVGFDPQTSGVLLFTSDGTDPEMLAAGTLDDVLAVANFGSNAVHNLGLLRAFRPGQPLMCGEFWCGWFDHWGKPRQGSSDASGCVEDIRWMKEKGASFNIYMFHGGTNFGFTSGANFFDNYAATVTGYDYHALLDEAGQITDKYRAICPILGGAGWLENPAPTLALQAERFAEIGSVGLFDVLDAPIQDCAVRPMEKYGQFAGGAMLYRTDIEGLGGGVLRVVDPHDYAIIYLDGQQIGRLDRRQPERTVQIPTAGGKRLEILVWALGRVNYGAHLLDHKGIAQRVELGRLTLANWEVFPMPMAATWVKALPATGQSAHGPAFYRYEFELDGGELRDTYLDLRHGWNIGAAWVNDHPLGRYWRIGPQQTLYIPGCWLRAGKNHLTVLDLEPASQRSVTTRGDAILNEIRS